MTGYDIFRSNGDLLVTVNVKTVDERDATSLILIGQGVPNYGTEIAQNFVWLLENFADSSAPINPMIGQHWYDTVYDRMCYYNGTEWCYYLAPASSSAALFNMLNTSQNIDFAVVASTAIFTATDATKTYCPDSLLLIPRGPFTAVTGATFNLSVSSAGDVLSSMALAIHADTQFVRLSVNQLPRMLDGSGTVSLNITTAATGGQLNYDAYLFGFTL